MVLNLLVSHLVNMESALTVAIIRSSSIGDVVLATACLDYLQKIDIAVKVMWIGRAPSLELIRHAYPAVTCFEIDHIYQPEVFAELSTVNLMADLQCTLRSRLLCLSVKRRYGTASVRAGRISVNRWAMVVMARLRGRHWRLPGAYQNRADHQFRKMTLAVHDGLQRLRGVKSSSTVELLAARPCLPMDVEAQNPRGAGRWLAVGVGAAYETKRAPIEVVAKILSRCQRPLAGTPIGLMLLGSDKDHSAAEQLVSVLNWPGPIQNLCGKLSLWQSALALHDNVKIILANDSALAHIAEAVGVPCAALFGPTVEAFGFVPWHNQSKAFSSALGCRPCSRHGKQTCRYGDRQCFVDLPTDLIGDHICEVLEG